MKYLLLSVASFTAGLLVAKFYYATIVEFAKNEVNLLEREFLAGVRKVKELEAKLKSRL